MSYEIIGLIILTIISIFFLIKYREWKSKYKEMFERLQSDITNLQKNNIELQSKYTELQTNFNIKVEEETKKRIEEARETAILRYAGKIVGSILEKIAPFTKKIKYLPEDMKFLGDPIDYVVFDGKSSDEVKKVVFLEVKSGTGGLNKIQKQIKDIIKNKNVEWEEVEFGEGTLITKDEVSQVLTEEKKE
ncbi:MAG: Holliday junction resolvase-like protein [Candidatus Aenigmatarchaeota archaeon]